MKKPDRLAALLLSGALALSLSACGKGDGPESAAPSAAPSESPSAPADLSQGPLAYAAGLSPTDTLLTVNGEQIPADLTLYYVSYSCSYFMSSYGQYGVSLADYAGQVLDDGVNLAVNEALLRQHAAQLGCPPTDAQLQAALAEGEANGGEVRNLLRGSYGLTDESIQYLLLHTAYYQNVLDAATHEPGAEELEEYLDSKGVFAVKHILLKTVDDSNQPLSEDQVAKKKELAEHLLTLLKASENIQSQAPEEEDLEARFDELMMTHSEDNPQNNPDGYVFDSSDSLVGGFREAALELEPGGLSGIVETDYGYHIMLRLPLTDETRAGYAQSFRADALSGQLAQWREEMELTRSDALNALDVADFYAKLTAYQQALDESGAGSGASAESGNVNP